MNTRDAYQSMLNRAHRRAALAVRFTLPRRAGVGMHRSSSLAAAIAARYALLERRWPTLAMAYQERGERGVSMLNLSPERYSTILLAPRLLLGLSLGHRDEKQASAAWGEPLGSIGRDQPSRAWAISHKSVQVVQKQTEVVERIVSRRIREERPERMADQPQLFCNARIAQGLPELKPSSSRSSSDRAYRCSPRRDEEQSVVQKKAKLDNQRTVATAVRSALPPVQSSSEIARITDHVLQALDRRIVAQRERMGRP